MTVTYIILRCILPKQLQAIHEDTMLSQSQIEWWCSIDDILLQGKHTHTHTRTTILSLSFSLSMYVCTYLSILHSSQANHKHKKNHNDHMTYQC